METPPATYSAFLGDRLLCSGALEDLLRRAKAHVDRAGEHGLLIFEDETGRQVDFDFRGTAEEVIARAVPAAPARPGPGRPRLGVLSREVSLLPDQWRWLEQQPNGISAALRRLVEDARRREPDRERARRARDAAGRFLTAIAGDRPGFEEAYRALFAGDAAAFAERIRPWPKDLRKHLERLTATVFVSTPTGR